MSHLPMSQSAVPSGTQEDDRSLHRGINKNVTNAPIVIDAEAEAERLNRLHQWQTMIHPNLRWQMDEVRETLAPRDGDTVRVLSICSGTGVWAAEMAKEFPHVEVLGVDIDPQRPSDTSPNCRFEAIDMENDDVTHLKGLFDVVHCGRAGGWIRYCKPFWARLTELVRPGGLLLQITGGMDSYDENKSPLNPAEVGQEPGTGSWWARLWVEFGKYSGIWLDITPATIRDTCMDWLQGNPELEDVKAVNTYLPLGWSGSNEDNLVNSEEIGRLVGNSAIERAKFVGPTLLANGMPAELLDLCMRELEAEILGQQFRNYTLWGFLMARKRAH